MADIGHRQLARRCCWASTDSHAAAGTQKPDGTRPATATEGGRATHDEPVWFEALALTYFEHGLSWATTHLKRDAFRRAFPHFASDVDLLMTGTSIVRNGAKIGATIHNARRRPCCCCHFRNGNIYRDNIIG